MGHDAPYAGRTASKSSRQRIRMSFWFPDMENRVRAYYESCKVCSLGHPYKKKDPVPIVPIPRGKFPFSHLIDTDKGYHLGLREREQLFEILAEFREVSSGTWGSARKWITRLRWCRSLDQRGWTPIARLTIKK